MRGHLTDALNNPGDVRAQRMALDRIGREASLANIAVMDWLKNVLAGTETAGTAAAVPVPAPIPAAAPAPISCRKCGREFRSQTALNGHGEARCRGRVEPFNSRPILKQAA